MAGHPAVGTLLPHARWLARYLSMTWLTMTCLVLASTVVASPLRDQPSPYLAMHADDPVQWRLWGPEVLAEARRSGRLILVSSGYFACHWCHVMQRESFRDAGIAAFLNRHFIPVKIDREQLPGLDQALIEFARRTRGRAGWPLNVVLTPAGDPLFAMLYEPPDGFLRAMQALQQRWSAQPETLARMAAAARPALVEAPAAYRDDAADAADTVADLRARLIARARAEADEVSGGFGEQSKFPYAPRLLALLSAEQISHDAWLAAFLRVTLTQMADQGLRDHLGGGFFRYTVDPHWREPHFEKMLGDNAQLAMVYLRAADVLGEARFRSIAFETLAFIERELCPDEGLCHAALSAVDAEGREGGYYLWPEATLAELFKDRDLAQVRDYWGMRGPSAFTDGYLPVPSTAAQPARDRLEALRARLLGRRARRVLPVDSQRLCGWNGLLLAAVSEAAVVAQAVPAAEHWRQRARSLQSALVTQCFDADGVLHSVAPRAQAGETTLDDMGQLAIGLQAYARLDGTAASRKLLRALLEQGWSGYAVTGGWRSVTASLIDYGPPQRLVADSAVTSGAALLLTASRWLARQENDAGLAARVDAALAADTAALRQDPLSHAGMVALILAQ